MTWTQKTIDDGKIRRWAKPRGGKPSRGAHSKRATSGGILRIDFGEPEDSLDKSSWEQSVETF